MAGLARELAAVPARCHVAMVSVPHLSPLTASASNPSPPLASNARPPSEMSIRRSLARNAYILLRCSFLPAAGSSVAGP